MRQVGAAVLVGSAVVLMWAFILPVEAVIPDTDLAFLEATSPSRANSSSALFSLIRPILAVGLFGALIFGAMYLSYRRRQRESSSELIRVIAASPVAQGVVVQVIDVGGILFVVSVSRAGVVVLGQISDREKISEIRTRVAQESIALSIPPIPFKTALEKLFRKPGVATPAAPGAELRPASRDKLLQEALDRVRRMNPTDKKAP